MTWVKWFLAIALTGTAMVVGLEGWLDLPFGFSLCTEFFVLCIAVAIADIQEWIESRSYTEDYKDWFKGVEIYTEEIEEELNGPFG